MIERRAMPPSVLGWREAGGTQILLSELWEQIEELGWFDHEAPRALVQIGQGCRSSLALETVRSLASFLRERVPQVPVHVVDAAARAGDWDGFELYDLATNEALCIAAVAAKRGLRVPTLWLESSFLITVAGAHPDPATRLAAVLDAQADPLRILGNHYTPEVLTYEAHRLAASNLSIACGFANWGDPASERWWAASPNDVAVDQVIATMAGADYLELPLLRSLTRHETFATRAELRGSLPFLTAYLAPIWATRAAAACSRLRAFGHGVGDDLVTARRTVRKMPDFIRRRLAARKRRAA